jgi:hypothetical protein
LRPALPQHTESVCRYVAQQFFHDPWQLRHAYPIEINTVGPILPKTFDDCLPAMKSRSRFHLLVNFGGLRSPVMLQGADTAFTLFALKLLDAALPPATSARVCLPTYLRDLISSELEGINSTAITVCYPSPCEFHSYLGDCDLLLTVPGLEVVLEALALRTPIAFLPPFNATQFYQAAVYDAHQVPVFSIRPDYLGQPAAPTADLAGQTQFIQVSMMQHRNDNRVLETLSRRLADALCLVQTDSLLLQNAGRRGRELLSSLGQSGRVETARLIEASLG